MVEAFEPERLWNKAVLFAQSMRVTSGDLDMTPRFAALSMEQLVKAALAKIHPSLILESKSSEEHVMAIYQKTLSTHKVHSITVASALRRAAVLIDEFVDEDASAMNRLMEFRNDSLHSGSDGTLAKNWEGLFFKAAIPLISSLGRTIEDFVGSSKSARAAQEQAEGALAQLQTEAHETVSKARAAYADLLKEAPSEVQLRIRFAELQSANVIRALAKYVHCPACENDTAILEGREVERFETLLVDSDTYTRVNMLPTTLHCSVCGLTLAGLSRLAAFDLSGRFQSDEHGTIDDLWEDANAPDRIEDY